MHARYAVNMRRLHALFPRSTLLVARAYTQTPPAILQRQGNLAIDPMTGEPTTPLDIEVGSRISTSVSMVDNYLDMQPARLHTIKTQNPRPRPPAQSLVFGRTFVSASHLVTLIFWTPYLADRPHAYHPMVFQVRLVHTNHPTLSVTLPILLIPPSPRV
jgi:hypothetical protein